MKSLLLALQFLTIIPVTHHFIASDKQLGFSAVFYPVIGLLIGSTLVFLATILLTVPVEIKAAIILIVWGIGAYLILLPGMEFFENWRDE